jgi:hypothetical protein
MALRTRPLFGFILVNAIPTKANVILTIGVTRSGRRKEWDSGLLDLS